jgi:hypothetical protein
MGVPLHQVKKEVSMRHFIDDPFPESRSGCVDELYARPGRPPRPTTG